MRPEDCALIILASGLSERFEGGNKLLADLNGTPVAQHAIDNLSVINFAKRYAVVPGGGEALRSLFTAAGYETINNPRPDMGQGVSLSLGAQAVVKDGYQSACIVLADMPLVDPGHIMKLLQAIDNANIIMSLKGTIKQPPAIFRGEELQSLKKISGEKGAKAILTMRNVKTVSLSEETGIDIDTYADLDRVSRWMQERTV